MDPMLGFRFRLLLGTEDIGFMRVSGLSTHVGEMVWEEINDTVTGKKLPDRLTFDDITLSRGVDNSHALVDWYADVVEVLKQSDGGVWGLRDIRRSVSIQVIQKAAQSVATFQIYSAWPKSLNWSDLNAVDSSVFVESLVLAHEGIRRVL